MQVPQPWYSTKFRSPHRKLGHARPAQGAMAGAMTTPSSSSSASTYARLVIHNTRSETRPATRPAARRRLCTRTQPNPAHCDRLPAITVGAAAASQRVMVAADEHFTGLAQTVLWKLAVLAAAAGRTELLGLYLGIKPSKPGIKP